jgi:hypothetical protein
VAVSVKPNAHILRHQVKVVHIEDCPTVASNEVSLAAIIRNCPLLETLM